MKQKVSNLIKGFLTAYAMRATISAPLQLGWYETKRDFYIAGVYELLGEYDFVFLFFLAVCTVFYLFLQGKAVRKASVIVTSAVFAILVPLGQCMRDTKSAMACFGSLVNVTKFVLMVAGFFFFFLYGISALKDCFVKKNFTDNSENFFTKRPFLKAFLILTAVYSLVTIIAYPGNLNADTIGQIYQVYGEMPYSEHHPLLSTFLVGGIVKLFDNITGSQAPGLFVYTLLQGAMLSAAFAYTIAVLSRTKLCKAGLWTVFIIYIVTPVYTNIASTAIKDVPFIAMVIVYVTLMMQIIEDTERLKSPRFYVPLIVIETFAMLLRNNGLYMIAITGFVLWLVWLKRFKGVTKITSILTLFLAAAVISSLINGAMSRAVNAEKVGKGDMLSLPFQTLGRYYSEFPDDFTKSERDAIEHVLGPMELSLSRYNPDLADQIKCKFIPTATDAEVMDFMKVWVKLFFRHPGAYIDGFLVHTYGWYCPVVSAEKRYETQDDDFLTPTGIFETIDKGLVFLYRFLNRISILGALENVGFATWAYIVLFVCTDGDKKRFRLMGVYILTALLICMASPAFLEHTRYGFPILCVVPFLWGFSLSEK